MKKLLLIDGSNVMFRAYYATAYSGNLMQNSKGEYTNAVFGLANMLNLIIKEDFTHALIAFDKGKETFRHKDFQDYKAKRKKMPEEFVGQLEYIRNLTERLGFFQYESEALEADDIIATIATKYYDEFDDIEIISNDKDLFQLLNSKVNIRLSKRGIKPEQSYTKKDLKKDMGLEPNQIPDLKGLMGDASDNLPGIPGVGEKTALKLLHEYHDIETLLKNMNELKGKLKERVEEHHKQALMCKHLATVIIDADLPITLDDIEYTGYDTEALVDFYQTMEFHSLIKRLDQKPKKKASLDVITLTKDDDLASTFAKDNALILEAFGSNYHHNNRLGFAWVNNHGTFYMAYHDAIMSDSFRHFLEDETKHKHVFDVKAMYVILMQEGIDMKGVMFDLLLAAYVLNPLNTKEDFKVIVQNFDYDNVPYLDAVYGKGAKSAIPDEKTVKQYAVKKAVAIDALKDNLNQEIKAQNQTQLLYQVELPLAKTLAKMEFEGIRIDQDALNNFNNQLEASIEEETKHIHSLAGEEFNVSSPKQLGVILFEKLKLPSYKSTKTGYSTGIDVLTKLKDKHAIISHIMNYRSLTKLQSTYVKGLKDALHDDGHIHTIYKQAFTQTGRLSSIEPNLQNIPIKTKLGREIRKVFIPREDDVLIAADYSQIELRVLADMANEKQLTKAFLAGKDIHTTTAQELFEKEDITSQERRIAKAVNFGIIYGQSAWGLSDDLNIKLKDAQTFIDKYYARFPGIATFMDNVIDKAKQEGFVTTILNRRRYIPEINSRIYAQREFGKRTAMNAPVQGSAADIIKLAMIKMDAELEAKNLQSKMILQIHDELVFTVPKTEYDTMMTLIKDVMEHAYDLTVPLNVDIASGDNLNDAK
ncbi:MAG: DNA polymerase I [Bacillota bacterium]